MADDKTSFTFTKYCFDTYKRFIKVTLAELRTQTLPELCLYDSTGCRGLITFRQYIVNGFVLNVNLDMEYEDEDEDDPETVQRISVHFDLFTGINKGNIINKHLGVFEDEWEDCKDIQKSLTSTLESYIGKEFKKCKQPFCHNIQAVEVDTEEWCKNCYISSFQREEKCSVCLEDDGYWMTLSPCGHMIHSACWQKVIGHNCPLCRTEAKFSKKSEF